MEIQRIPDSLVKLHCDFAWSSEGLILIFFLKLSFFILIRTQFVVYHNRDFNISESIPGTFVVYCGDGLNFFFAGNLVLHFPPSVFYLISFCSDSWRLSDQSYFSPNFSQGNISSKELWAKDFGNVRLFSPPNMLFINTVLQQTQSSHKSLRTNQKTKYLLLV